MTYIWTNFKTVNHNRRICSTNVVEACRHHMHVDWLCNEKDKSS